MAVRPTPEQALSLAPDRSAAAAALAVATQSAWSAAGCDDTAVWGTYIATAAEPYAVAVDLSDDVRGPAYRCNCMSRKVPCKHAIGLLVLHANGAVAPARRLPFAEQWLQRRAARAESTETDSAIDAEVATHDGAAQTEAGDGALGGGARAPRAEPPGPMDPSRQKRLHDRAQRMQAGLQELDRWLADRVRVGLAAPEFADPATWERVAARLVDAQCGALANRVKRVALKVGARTGWHEDVLEEIALLHALAVGAQRVALVGDRAEGGGVAGSATSLAEGVQVATGLVAAKDDVLAGVPSTARWIVAGESRTREDRITVQRTWLVSIPESAAMAAADTWAMILAFGVFGNELTSEHEVGMSFEADVHWYPGGINLRALIGKVHRGPVRHSGGPRPVSLAHALAAAGWALAAEPWLERYPMCIAVTPACIASGHWVLVDESGSIGLHPGFGRIAEVVSVSGGSPVTIVGEWSTDGFLPLTLFADEQVVVL